MFNKVALTANIGVGVDALRIHPLRTVLSVLGIIIGSASLVATMAISDGIMEFARGEITQETSVQVIAVGSRTMDYRDRRWVPIPDYPVFTMADVESARESIPGLAGVTMILNGSISARFRGIEQNASLTLGTADLPDFSKIELGAGRFFSAIEAMRDAPVIVINHALAKELAPGPDPYSMVDQDIQVRGRIRRVIGVLVPNRFDEARNPDFAAFAPIRAANSLLGPPTRGRFTPDLQLKAPTVESVIPVRDATIEWLAGRYVRWQDRVYVRVGLDLLAEMETAILLVKLFFGALVGISLLVGGIGVMNVLLSSVSERTREIGIRKAVGARRADIRMQFLAESTAIAVAGTVIGLVIGVLIALLVTAVFRMIVGVEVYPSLSASTVVLAIGSSSIVGLVFGTVPARRAANLPPVLAIAHE